MEFILQSYSPVVNPSQWSSDIGFDDLKCFDDISSEDVSNKNENLDTSFWDQLTNLLSKHEGGECDYANEEQDRIPHKRCRLDLDAKKNIVYQYYEFCSSHKNDNESSDVDDEFRKHSVKQRDNGTSIRAFVRQNNAKKNCMLLEHSNLSKWVRAEKRGEYLPWESNIKAQTARKKSAPQKIIKLIDKTLKLRDKYHGAFNKIVRSPSIPGEYGVVARKFTPAGTFLGYYKGKVITGVENDTRNHDYTFSIGRNKFIDASDYYSCFARYYNCSLKSADQNVCVEILSDWTNPQKAICFIANKDIRKGAEYLISYGPEYWEATAANIPATSPFRRACNTLSGKSGSLESIEPLYSIDAPFLAAEFGDDKSVSSVDEDSDYSEE
jgi:hypothetical protein